MSPLKLIEIGKVLKERGIKGELKLLPFTNDLERFKQYTHFFIKDKKLEVEYFKNLGRFLVLKIKGIENIEQSLKYKNSPVMIERHFLPKKDVLIEDYLGLKVLDETNKIEIGVVSAYMESGINGLFQIMLPDQTTKLIPASLDFFSLPDFKVSCVYLKNYQALI